MKVPTSTALVVILSSLATAGVLVDRAATKATETPKVVWTPQECAKCHTDARTLDEFYDKRGESNSLAKAYDAYHKTLTKGISRPTK